MLPNQLYHCVFDKAYHVKHESFVYLKTNSTYFLLEYSFLYEKWSEKIEIQINNFWTQNYRLVSSPEKLLTSPVAEIRSFVQKYLDHRTELNPVCLQQEEIKVGQILEVLPVIQTNYGRFLSSLTLYKSKTTKIRLPMFSLFKILKLPRKLKKGMFVRVKGIADDYEGEISWDILRLSCEIKIQKYS